MYFFRPKDFGAPIEICPGCTTRVVVGGDRIMFSFVEIKAVLCQLSTAIQKTRWV